jgi:hypothetical protein
LEHRYRKIKIIVVFFFFCVLVDLSPAIAKFTIAFNVLKKNRDDFVTANNKVDRMKARANFKMQRNAFRNSFNDDRVAFRKKLEGKSPEHKAYTVMKKNLLAARFALQLLKKIEGLSSTNVKELPESELCGQNIKNITLQNAPVELIDQARSNFQQTITDVLELQSELKTCESKETRKAAQQQFKQKRKELHSRLNESRIAARKSFDQATTPELKTSAKRDLVVARLAIQMFNQEPLSEYSPVDEVKTGFSNPTELDQQYKEQLEAKFEQQLQILANMGFHDLDLLVPILVESQGSIQLAVTKILPE